MLLRTVWTSAAFALLALAPGCGQAVQPAEANIEAAAPVENFDAAGLARFDAAIADRAAGQVRAGYASILAEIT